MRATSKDRRLVEERREQIADGAVGLFIKKGLKDNPSGAEADFLHGKFYTMRFFFAYELPRITAFAQRLINSDGLTVEIKPDYFSD